MRKLLDGDGCARGPRLGVEIRVVHLVVASVVLHVDQIARRVDDVAQVRARRSQRGANVLNHAARLFLNVQRERACGMQQEIDK